MGIHDREYARDDRHDRGEPQLRAIPALIALTVGAFVVQLFTSPGHNVADPLLRHGGFDFAAINDGEAWRLLTSFFVQVYRYPLLGIILGMLALYWFGTELEDRYGTRGILWFYLLAGLFVSVGKLALGHLGVDPGKVTAGSGGPIFAVLTLFALHHPQQQVLLLLVIPLPMRVLVPLLVGVYVLLFVTDGGSKMEIAVPLLGAAFGAAYYKLVPQELARPRDDYRRSEKARPKLTLRPADPPADDAFDDAPITPPRPRAGKPDEYLEAKLEAVLEKITKTGRASLTPEENAVLLKASEVYRQKGK